MQGNYKENKKLKIALTKYLKENKYFEKVTKSCLSDVLSGKVLKQSLLGQAIALTDSTS